MTIQIRIRIYQNNADPHADPTPSFSHVTNRATFFVTFIHSNASLQYLSFQWQRCHIIKILERILNFYGKTKKYMVVGIYTVPDRPDSDRQALDDDSNPTK
jgi:hypothetical protein